MPAHQKKKKSIFESTEPLVDSKQ